ncbi:sulfite reductase [NADPH] flavoprotein alpha-component [Cloacibacterium rupense]|uniref:Sulfite reductase [NADPH] flavoprotein alpha-component n=1 Tax=Cloacibacterium rupense TaxID=517423 RepID=A0ABQ2NG17_9FLAO|nr:flavodoxin domain-containing protein [Cloacibacterium rupense]GGP02422.1 sulfite reductase [NADPH] flavoprotein alpha-component [Cloacibacterium rupense]
MLSDTKQNLLQQLVSNATYEELIYSKGFLAGYIAKSSEGNLKIENTSVPLINVKPLIVYGTETGNAKKVASKLQANFKKEKINAKSVDIFQFDVKKLEKETLILFIISTQGEGELPLNAKDFYEKLKSSNVNLNQLSYAVFGLGDSSYPLFCEAGRLLDEVLEEKGAKRLLPLVKADVDFNPLVEAWQKDLQNLFSGVKSETKVAHSVQIIPHKKNYKGIIKHKIVLNDTGSNKETYHLEIISDDEIAYQPGDALGIIPKNSKEDIDFIINYFDAKSNDEIAIKNETKTVFDWLELRNIKGLSKRSLDLISEVLPFENIWEKADLIDVLKSIKTPKLESNSFQKILEILLPVAPRLYSISSSSEAHDGEVHLTVNLNKFNANDEKKTGFASQYFADFPLNQEFEFYIHKNENFRLPEDDKDIILIGPGTGIAPFRSFLAGRDANGAEGKNWLFFGEQHFTLDFYYQTEIQEWLSTGVLTKLSTAFSRDQEKKIYVQDRIKENAREFNSWIENGAYIYLCGQKEPMSKDVENTIVEVISTQRNISVEQAKTVVEELENQGRFLKDVY